MCQPRHTLEHNLQFQQKGILLQEAGKDTSPLAPLAAHRRVLGVVGLFYCPAIADLAMAYAAFEKQCRCTSTLLFLRVQGLLLMPVIFLKSGLAQCMGEAHAPPGAGRGGPLSLPAIADLATAYAAFEKQCRWAACFCGRGTAEGHLPSD